MSAIEITTKDNGKFILETRIYKTWESMARAKRAVLQHGKFNTMTAYGDTRGPALHITRASKKPFVPTAKYVADRIGVVVGSWCIECTSLTPCGKENGESAYAAYLTYTGAGSTEFFTLFGTVDSIVSEFLALTDPLA